MRLRRPLGFLKAAPARAWQGLRSSLSAVGQAVSRWPRWLRLTALVLSTLLGCLLVFNLAINLGVARPFLSSLISPDPRSLRVDYRRAWAFWPTHVYLRDVEVRGSDANLEWRVEAAEARVSIAWTALLEREFHITKLRVEGHFRQRGAAKTGVFQVSASPFSVGIELQNEETNVILIGTAVEPPLEAPKRVASAR